MPYAINKYQDHSLIIVYFWGELDDDSVLQYIRELPKHGFADEPADLLLVVDDAAEVKVKTDLIRLGARQDAGFHSGSRQIIVANQAVAFGLSRLYFTEAGGQSEAHFIFSSIEDAAIELNIRPEVLRGYIQGLRA